MGFKKKQYGGSTGKSVYYGLSQWIIKSCSAYSLHTLVSVYPSFLLLIILSHLYKESIIANYCKKNKPKSTTQADLAREGLQGTDSSLSCLDIIKVSKFIYIVSFLLYFVLNIGMLWWRRKVVRHSVAKPYALQHSLETVETHLGCPSSQSL